MELERMMGMAGLCLLSTGCLKDGVDPPQGGQGAHVDLVFRYHCNGRPFHVDSLYQDGFGTLVRFDHVRFALVGAALLGNEGQPMGHWPAATFVADLSVPDHAIALEAPSAGEVHWMDTRTVRPGDRGGALDSLWAAGPDGAFQAVLDVRGICDSNGNGTIDAGDAPFRITVAPDQADPALRLHGHCIVPANGKADLPVWVDLEALLHDIDLPDAPVTIGTGPYATQALANLRARVLGDDNMPR